MKKLSDQFAQMGIKEALKKDLMSAYEESLKDKYFSALVKKLKMDAGHLMKYTSLLEESSIDYGHCQKCKGILECKNKITGYS